MSSSVVVLGSINTDLVIRTPNLPQPGETVIGGEFYQVPGGKGANQAVAASRSGGMPVRFLGAVGNDAFGEQSLKSLAESDVSTEHIVRVDCASGVALIMVDHSGENSISVASGANAHLTPEYVQGIGDEVFSSPGVFLACLESPVDSVAAGLKRAKSAGQTTILNPAPANVDVLEDDTLSCVDILTPNESELAQLASRPVGSESEIEAAARSLLELGVSLVIVTRGRAGASIIGPTSVEHVSAFEVEAIDTTAAGDVFNGVLAASLASDVDLRVAVRRANAAAAVSVTCRGAQSSIPTVEEAERFLADQS